MNPTRIFNTEGPILAAEHYHIPPLERVDLDAILTLIDQKKYFVLHAPRQTGKTSALQALAKLLNDGDEYRCVYVNVEVGQSAREDVSAGMRAILNELALETRETLAEGFLDDEIWMSALEKAGPHSALSESLTVWARASEKPLVLLIDEIDALVGDTLLAMLRQLRAGYVRRPRGFPQSIVLCGVRDVRDYRIPSTAENSLVLGGSAFNISAESLRLGNFSSEEVEALLMQHTEETGQPWDADAKAEIWNVTQGQPWLVNALAYEVCFRKETGRDRSRAITVDDIRDAREQLILRRVVHLDQLAHKLTEDRVRRVIEPLLSGVDKAESIPADDLKYVRDLGLVSEHGIAIANPIYREVVPRDLTYTTQEAINADPVRYIDRGGNLMVERLLVSFQQFFREHSEHWVERFQYKEAGPQLLLQAFLQRIVNSGGRIEREYGLGRMRTDLLIFWPRNGDRSKTQQTQRIVIECKLLHKSLGQTVQMVQAGEYARGCQGHRRSGQRSRINRHHQPQQSGGHTRQQSHHGQPVRRGGGALYGAAAHRNYGEERHHVRKAHHTPPPPERAPQRPWRRPCLQTATPCTASYVRPPVCPPA